MDIIDGRKDLFVKYLDNVRKGIYIQILDCNGELVNKLYKKKLSDNLEGDPLWLFHGGELINLYSTAKNKVPTKDIDLKMYFTGDFSIPHKVFKKALGKIKSVRLSDFDFYDEAQTKKQETILLRGFKGFLSNTKVKPSVNFFHIWDMGEEQKVRMCASLVANNLKGTYSQLNLKTGRLTQGVERETMMKCRSQKWATGDQCKAFIVNTPYVTQVGRDNVPYDINDKVLSQMDVDYDEDMDGYHIDEGFLDSFDSKVKVWTQDPKLMSQDKKQKYLERQLKIIRIKNQKFKLSTVVGVVLVHNESRGEWYMFQEGLLDTFIDYSAGHHLDLEKRYAGRYQDGSFPSIMKKVSYKKNKTGIMRFPSLTWLIYDQMRMLYVTIRGEYLGCDEHKCKWVPLGGGAAGNHEKYFKKLKGMLNSFESVIESLHSGDTEEVHERLSQCKKRNVEECGPLPFLGDLFQNFEMELLRDRRAGSKKTKKAKKAKKAKKSKKAKKRMRQTQRHSSRYGQTKGKSSTSKLHQKMELMNQDIFLN
jgi:hypothetical protein